MSISNLTGVSLTSEGLIGAGLSDAELLGADVTNANFSAANLSSVLGLDLTIGSAGYTTSTDFTGTGFDPVAAGWSLLDPPVGVPSLGAWGLMLLAGGLLLVVGAQLRRPASV